MLCLPYAGFLCSAWFLKPFRKCNGCRFLFLKKHLKNHTSKFHSHRGCINVVSRPKWFLFSLWEQSWTDQRHSEMMLGTGGPLEALVSLRVKAGLTENRQRWGLDQEVLYELWSHWGSKLDWARTDRGEVLIRRSPGLTGGSKQDWLKTDRGGDYLRESRGSYDLTGGSKLDWQNTCRGGAKFRRALDPLVSMRVKTRLKKIYY